MSMFQCSICGHHEHYPHICIVGTEKHWTSSDGEWHQIMCSCDGKHKESCTDL